MATLPGSIVTPSSSVVRRRGFDPRRKKKQFLKCNRENLFPLDKPKKLTNNSLVYLLIFINTYVADDRGLSRSLDQQSSLRNTELRRTRSVSVRLHGREPNRAEWMTTKTFLKLDIKDQVVRALAIDRSKKSIWHGTRKRVNEPPNPSASRYRRDTQRNRVHVLYTASMILRVTLSTSSQGPFIQLG